MADRVVIEVDLDASGAVTGGRRVEGAIGRIGKEADGAQRGGLGKLKAALAGMVTVAALQQLARYAGRIYDLATAAEETSSKFATVYGPAAQALDDRLRDLANRAGLTQTEIRGLAATGGAVAQGMGMGKEASADFAAEMVTLAADVASFSNAQGGAEQVMQAFISATTGEREALKTLGIVISEEDVKQRQATRAAEGHRDALTQQGKATATLELITEKAGDAVGDLDRTQDSAANTGRMLAAVTREEEERFARLNQVTIRLVQDGLKQLILTNREGGRSFAETLARGVLIAVGALAKGVQAGGRLVRALSNLSSTAAAAVGAGGGFSLLATGVNTVMVGLINLEIGVLKATQAFQVLNLAKAAFGDDKEMQEAKDRMREIAVAIADARIELDKYGRSFAGISLPRGGLSAGMASSLEEFERVADTLDALGPIVGDDLSDAVDAGFQTVVDATDAGGVDVAEALKRANEKAERERREGIDKAFETRELRIAAMRGDLAREIAEIDLASDRRIEAFRRAYGALTAEQAALFAQIRQGQQEAARLASFGLDEVTITARGDTRSPQDRLRDERDDETLERIRALSRLRTAGMETADALAASAQSVSDTMLALVNNYGGAVAGVIGMLEGVFSQAAQEGGKNFEIYKGLAIASATINTYESATAAYKALAGIPVVGPGLGATAAVLAVTAGLANVNRIRQQQPGGSSSGGSGYGRGRSGGVSSISAGLALGGQQSSAAGGQAAAPIVNVAPSSIGDIVVVTENNEVLARSANRGAQKAARLRGGSQSL